MAKITHSGPSFSDDELSDPDLPTVVRENLPANEDRPVTRFMFGISDAKEGDESSVGSNLSPSSGDASSSSKTGKGTPQDPAPGAESPSDQLGQEPSDDALSTDGGIPETEMESGDEDVPPYFKWGYRELQAECKVRELVATGSHEELVARLEKFDERHASE